MAIDPVCRLKVDPSHADGTTTYGGRTYYFCSLVCKGYFDKNPSKYASNTGHAAPPVRKEGRLRKIFLTR